MRLLTPYKHILWPPVLKWEQWEIENNKGLIAHVLTIINTYKKLTMHLLTPYKHILWPPVLKWEQFFASQ